MTSNEMVPANFGTQASVFSGAPRGDELSAGITTGFAIVSYRGKVWAVKHQGVETPLMREDGDGPRGSIEVVIVKAASPISKIFYEAGFEPGSTAPPDCWSTNGVVPDPAAPKKQSPTCAGCPKNAWGSKVTDAGKQAKACSDSKRLAVVPLADIDNELAGGPMLLRVPAASLKDVKNYGDTLQSLGYAYYAVATRISFDPAEAFPKFVFKAIRPLTNEEGTKVLALHADLRVSRILNEAVENVHHEPAQVTAAVPATPFEKTKVVSQNAPQVVKPAEPAPKTKKELLQEQLAAMEAEEAAAKAEKAKKAKPKTKKELLQEQLAAAEAEEATPTKAADDIPAHLDRRPQAAEAAAPADFDKMLDDLLPTA